MHSPRLSGLAQMCAFSIIAFTVDDAVGQTAPLVTKSITPDTVEVGDYGYVTITLTPTEAGEYAGVKDPFPPCIRLADPLEILWMPANCASDYRAEPDSFGFSVYQLNASCQASVRVQAVSAPPPPCQNTTYAPYTIYQDAGGVHQVNGTPASASWTINAPTTLTFTGPGGNLSDSTNTGGTPAADDYSLSFGGALPTTILDDSTVNWREWLITGDNYTINPASTAIVLGLVGTVFNVAGGTGTINVPWKLTANGTIEVDQGRLFYSGPINLNGNNLLVAGAADATLNGGIHGTGVVGEELGGTLTVLGSIASSVSFDVLQGTLKPVSAFTGPINIHGTGALVVAGGPFGALTLSGHGSINAAGSLPATVNFSQIDITNGTIIVGVTPTAQSKYVASGAITFNGGTAVQLNLTNAPSAGDTIPIFSTTGGSVTECPDETYSNIPGVLARAVCTPTSVFEEIVATEDIFNAGDDSCPPSATGCQFQCTTELCEK